MFNLTLNNLIELIRVNLKIRYRDTILGFIWVIFNPITLFAVQAIIFKNLLKIGPNDYLYYLMSGLLPWFFITQTVEMSSNHLKNNSAIIKNICVSPFVLIATLVIENYLNFIVSSIIINIYLYINYDLSFKIIFSFYLCSLFLFFIVLPLSFLVSYLQVLFKDIKFIIHFVFTILYFFSPTFFTINYLPDNLQSLIKLNPFFWILSFFRVNTNFNNNLNNSEVIVYFFSILALINILVFILSKKLHRTVLLNI